MTYLIRILTSFALVGVLFLFDSGSGLGPGEAWAQTATKLKCKKCVGAKQLKKNAVKGNRLKSGAVGLSKLESGLGERANSTQPFYITMDANNEEQTIITHGPLTFFARCSLNEPDGGGGFQDAVRIFATSSVAGWFTFDTPNGLAGTGPFAAGQEVEVHEVTTPVGTILVEDVDNGDGIVAPDGSTMVSYPDDSNLIALNALGNRCTHGGITFVSTNTP